MSEAKPSVFNALKETVLWIGKQRIVSFEYKEAVYNILNNVFVCKKEVQDDRKAIFCQFPWAACDAVNVFYAAEHDALRFLVA